MGYDFMSPMRRLGPAIGLFFLCATVSAQKADQGRYGPGQTCPAANTAEALVITDAGKKTSITCSIAPMLSVRNGAAAAEFYKAAFGAVEVYRVEDPGGSVVSRLSVDGAEFWVADESPEHANFSPESLGGGTVRMILTVPDPDATFAQALAAGARVVVAVEEAYGWRVGRMVDPFGHHWEIGHPLA